jgi:hypothetical protein
MPKRSLARLWPAGAALPWQGKAHRFWYWFCAACLALYLTYAAYLAPSRLFADAAATAGTLLWLPVVFLCAFWGLLWVSHLRLGTRLTAARAMLKPWVFVGGAGLALFILGAYLLAADPGGVTVDSAVQWTQALTGTFVNWHPAFHTLLLRLISFVKTDYTFAVAVQCGLYSLAFGYLLATLRAWGVRALPLFVMGGLVTASPIVGNTMMYLWKDNFMTIGVVVLTAQAVNLFAGRGAWLARWPNALAFGLALACTTLVRHNALLFSVPLLLCALFTCRAQWKGGLTALAAMLATLALVLGPLYAALHVVYPQNGVEEAVGVPMTVICDVRKAGGQGLDAETRAFTDRMADSAGWDAYQPHNYNSIKFGATRGLIAHTDLATILRMAASAAKSAPQVAFQAVNGVTDLVWGLADEGAANVKVRNSGDLASLPKSLPPRMPGPALLVNAVIAPPLSIGPVSWYVGNIGVSFALMLICALTALRRFGPRALLLCMPVLLYNLGTMCVLCGPDARFFSYSPLICTLLLPVLLARAPAAQTSQDGTVAR